MDELKHYSVMLNESIELLDVNPDGIYVDATLGGGGHSEAILKKLKNGHLFAIDQDEYAISKALVRLEPYRNKLTIIKSNFVNIKEDLAELGIEKVDGIIYDLGVSSFQFDDESRGFSYRFDAPLDMRMNKEQTFSAYDVVNTYSEEALRKILFEYGEEKNAFKIVRSIIKKRSANPIETTFELVDAVKSGLPASELRKPGHPAKQTFQAIRIEVNKELEVLKESLKKSLDLLNINGKCVVITFHSLEDRIVKQIFKDATTLKLPKDLPFIPEGMNVKFELLNHKVIVPSDIELSENNRSHSAKLRAIKRISQ